MYCWGSNSSGQLGSAVANGTATPTRVWSILAIEVAASGIATGSGSHSCAISKDRLTVWCWGRNDTGQLGNGATTAGGDGEPDSGDRGESEAALNEDRDLAGSRTRPGNYDYAMTRKSRMRRRRGEAPLAAKPFPAAPGCYCAWAIAVPLTAYSELRIESCAY